jgi:hypothetical protein
MLKRSLRRGACVAVVAVVGGCATPNVRLPAPRSTPPAISPLQRILVAGFVTGDGGPVDVNRETARRLRFELRRQAAAGVIESDPLRLSDEGVFADTLYWRRVGEEFGSPLIVTGSVRLRRAPPAVSQRSGRGGVHVVQPGYFLEARLVTIDGATGRVRSSEALPRQVRYDAGRRASLSFLYSEMMESLMPALLRAIIGAR